ncbi:MAG: TonB-dependent receptor [Opitutaceae bacterium]
MNFFWFLTLSIVFVSTLRAQTSQTVAPDNPVTLDRIDVNAARINQSPINALTLPFTASITAQRIEETINIVDTEDAVKYLPSVFLRKRNYGDTQAVMATRVWGVSSSARSLIFADGVPLTALIANNNNIGAPRWGLVAPVEIERIDIMYGPFSAAYAGNSLGAVMEITTRLPEKFEASLSETLALQTFNLYGTDTTYRTLQTAVSAGHRLGKFSFLVSANYQDSHSQPLSYVTGATLPSGTTGGYSERNKLGAAANVIGSSGLLHTRMTNAKLKLAYDLTPILRAAYTIGYWRNNADSSVGTYLRDAAGQPTFAGQAGFASGYNRVLQEHSSHSLSLKTDTKDHWDFDAAATLYRLDKDKQRTPTNASATGTSFGNAGRYAILGGSGWSTLDLKGTWRSEIKNPTHTITFGAHDDRYKLYNPTLNTPDWLGDAPATTTVSEGNGKTRTQAVFLQELWQPSPDVKFTIGGRYEEWRAYDGYNANGATVVRQPTVSAEKFSPKTSVAWTPARDWIVTVSLAKAYRFATASELYQLVTTGTTFTSPNPILKPDDVTAAELKLERTFGKSHLRVSLFEDDIHDAIIAQFNTLVPGSPTLYSYPSNVDHVRARGVELVLESHDILIRGLEFAGSVTYLDAKTLALSGRASATASASAAIGKKLPNIPDWRATFTATYRLDPRWAFSLGGRYSDKLWTTLDNTDVNPNTYQGFAPFFVADTHVNARLNACWRVSLGIDNILNRKYFLFHPFPQRTFVTSLSLSL